MSSTEERIAAGAAARVALDRGNPEPAPEADEREALLVAIDCGWDRDGQYEFERSLAADAVLAAGFRRSQPAPRTVSAEEVDAGITHPFVVGLAEDSGCDRRSIIVGALASVGIEVSR